MDGSKGRVDLSLDNEGALDELIDGSALVLMARFAFSDYVLAFTVADNIGVQCKSTMMLPRFDLANTRTCKRCLRFPRKAGAAKF